MMLDVIQRRMRDRQCLERCPGLLSEVATLMDSYGPLVLLQHRLAMYVPLDAGQPLPLFSP